MSHKLLAIVGATATGKTGLAVKLSKLFPSLLVSADSRQVYRGMDIVTGKDHPAGVKLAGLNLADPDQEFSVGQWQAAVMPVITRAWGAGQLPIVVGGTGLYLRAVTTGIATATIPPNPKMREGLEPLSVEQLQDRLGELDPAKLAAMNESDRANPRRLVRAIEIATSPIKPQASSLKPQALIIGLKYSNDSNHSSNIRQRVIDRLQQGALAETQALLAKYSPDLPSFTSLGYRHLLDHLAGQITKGELIDHWTREELAYAKRQLTWFNKVPDINWFKPADPQLLPQVASLVKDWYSGKG